MRYHVLGVGSIGTLIAHHLRRANPQAPISLIVRRGADFSGRRGDALLPIDLSVTRHGREDISTGFDLETWKSGGMGKALRSVLADSEDRTGGGGGMGPGAVYDSMRHHGLGAEYDVQAEGPIQSLIVCLKTSATLSAMEHLVPRLSPNSVITLLQNGMGVYDQLCSRLFTDPAKRPFFILGSTTHGATAAQGTSAGTITHHTEPGKGDVKLGVVPDSREEVDIDRWLFGDGVDTSPLLAAPRSPMLPLSLPPSNTSVDYSNLHNTLEGLLSMTELSPALLPMPHMHHQLLLKVALNAVINPLTAILGRGALPNGSLVQIAPGRQLISELCEEVGAVLQAYIHYQAPAGDPAPELIRFFAADSLEKRVVALCHATAKNTSSMAVDIGKARETEVQHINGYLVDLGRRLGVDTPLNSMLVEMVKFTAAAQGLGSRLPKAAVKAVAAQTADERQTMRKAEEARMQERAQDKRRIEQEKLDIRDQQHRDIIRARRAERRIARKSQQSDDRPA